MKTLKLSAIVICLILISISPENRGADDKDQRFPFIISGTISAFHGQDHKAEKLNIADIDSVMINGRKLFERTCTACHGSRFVWESGAVSDEADLIITQMLEKSGDLIPPARLDLLKDYLHYKLPSR
ncbi:MAG: hypothetical protein U9N45_04345 [Gemmatimonadota bacterium]|nr:hypothetical protein [Gemmatimonadota bacterium]